MSELPPEIEQADAMLARLASLDLQAAQHVHECLLATTEPAEVADLSRAYARASRSLRQTLALHAKLKIDRAKAAREADQREAWTAARLAPGDDLGPAPDTREYAVCDRVEDLREAVDRVISRVADGDRRRHTEMAHRFDREMDDWAEADDFLDLEVEAHIRQACRRLGLPEDLARAWRQLPEPAFVPEPEARAPEAGSHPPPTDAPLPRSADRGG